MTTLYQIVDWIVDHIVRFVFYLADGFPAVDTTLGATALSGGALSSSDDENDDDEDHSNGDDSDTSDASTSTSETENYCVVDGAEGTNSTEIPLEDKDESAL